MNKVSEIIKSKFQKEIQQYNIASYTLIPNALNIELVGFPERPNSIQ